MTIKYVHVMDLSDVSTDTMQTPVIEWREVEPMLRGHVRLERMYRKVCELANVSQTVIAQANKYANGLEDKNGD